MHSESLSQPSFASYLRAAFAIARKDVLHLIRYPFNLIFHVIEPLVWLTPIYFLGLSFSSNGSQAGFSAYTGIHDYMGFMLLGSAISNFVAAVFWGMGFSLKQEMDSGVLESNWLTPIPRPLFLAGQTLSSLAITLFNSIVMLGLAALLFDFRLTGNVLGALAVLVPMLVVLYGFGFAFASLVLLMRDANTLVDVSNYLVSSLSGSNFPVQVLPRFLLPISLALPLTYGYDAVRGLMLGSQTILPIGTEIAILLVSMVVMVAFGLTVFRAVERRCRQRGTIGMH